MNQTFYQYMMRFVDHDKNDPTSRLANIMHRDISFPKQADDFAEISDYLEGQLDYSRLLTVFDDIWTKYLNEK